MHAKIKLLVFAIAATFATLVSQAQTNQFRGIWVDAFGPGLKTPQQVSTLVADARRANFNAIVAQVRRRADVFYNSDIEPKAAEVADDYDPLADLIKKTHDTNSGPRIEVHAWIVAYPIWNNEKKLPPAKDHLFRVHKDWLTKDAKGATWNGHNYVLEPAHPEVQEHLFKVSMELVSKYDIDGLNFDYIRYDDNTWGYHEIALKRFHALTQEKGVPKPTDPEWMQFRRDQVTALVRKIYLSTIATKPHVKVSAACNSRAPGIRTTAEWPKSAAWSSTLQDWHGWIQEGIVDFVMPMTYFDQNKWATAWTNWSIFEKDHRYNRHVVMGPGPYQNSISNALVQLHSVRDPSPKGNRADGMCLYCYAVLSKDRSPSVREEFLKALTEKSVHDPRPEPVFANPASPPVMPWKVAPTKGHLKGFVSASGKGKVCDGAKILLKGPSNRTLTSDATGFYGAVDVPPGDYEVVASIDDQDAKPARITITAGKVSNLDFTLKQ